jgi:hypothetical protein
MPAPTGPQFVRVFHRSNSDVPVHLQEATIRQVFHPDSNNHPDVFHVGTEESASVQRFSNRPYMHEYEIDMSHPSISPVTWGEEGSILRDQQKVEESPETATLDKTVALHIFNDSMRGKQEGLFESVPADAEYSAEKGVILPYRNRVEDQGSISYIVPKSSVGSAVRFVGVNRVQTPYDKVK